MRLFLLLTLVALTSACSTLAPSNGDARAVIEQSVTLNWGIHKHNPGHMLYQHQGIPGNLASIPHTRTPQESPLAVVVLGEPLAAGTSIDIRILGVHEQASRKGLISTIIASTQAEGSLESLELNKSGALAVIEAGLVQLGGPGARSLGFRSPEKARQTIERTKLTCSPDC